MLGHYMNLYYDLPMRTIKGRGIREDTIKLITDIQDTLNKNHEALIKNIETTASKLSEAKPEPTPIPETEDKHYKYEIKYKYYLFYPNKSGRLQLLGKQKTDEFKPQDMKPPRNTDQENGEAVLLTLEPVDAYYKVDKSKGLNKLIGGPIKVTVTMYKYDDNDYRRYIKIVENTKNRKGEIEPDKRNVQFLFYTTEWLKKYGIIESDLQKVATLAKSDSLEKRLMAPKLIDQIKDVEPTSKWDKIKQSIIDSGRLIFYFSDDKDNIEPLVVGKSKTETRKEMSKLPYEGKLYRLSITFHTGEKMAQGGPMAVHVREFIKKGSKITVSKSNKNGIIWFDKTYLETSRKWDEAKLKIIMKRILGNFTFGYAIYHFNSM